MPMEVTIPLLLVSDAFSTCLVILLLFSLYYLYYPPPIHVLQFCVSYIHALYLQEEGILPNHYEYYSSPPHNAPPLFCTIPVTWAVSGGGGGGGIFALGEVGGTCPHFPHLPSLLLLLSLPYVSGRCYSHSTNSLLWSSTTPL